MNTHLLSDDLRQAIDPSGFARLRDERTEKVYLIIEESRAGEFYDRWLREQLQVGFDEADRGDVAEWNLGEFLAKMHAQHSSNSTE